MIRCAILTIFLIQVALSLDLTYSGPPTGRSTENTLISIDAFLVKFGFHFLEQGETLASITPEKREEAIKKYQQRKGLPATGDLNDQTISRIVRKRCGTPDIEFMNDNMKPPGPKGRFAIIYGTYKWERPLDLAYFIENFTPDLPQETIVQAIKDGWSYWESVANIKTRRVMNRADARMFIKFVKGNHGDGDYQAFVKNDPVLAHAQFPGDDGQIHFNEDKTWTEDVDEGVNLRNVAAHEFGHALGLDHSNESNALMSDEILSPTGYFPRETCVLSQDDIDGIRFIYGRGGTGDVNRCGPSVVDEQPVAPVEITTKTKTVVTATKAMRRTKKPKQKPITPKPPRTIPRFSIPSSAADPCNTAIDAIWLGSDEHYWAIRGPWLYRATSDGEIVEVKQTNKKFKTFPLRPDAATFDTQNGKLYVFKDVRVWEYSETGAFLRIQRATSANYPGKIRGKSKAAYLDSDGNIKIIFGTDIYQFDEENIDNTRKVSTTDSFDLNNEMFDAATSDRDNIYLFRGKNYRKISKDTMKVVDGYNTGSGRNIGIAFFGCSGKAVPK